VWGKGQALLVGRGRLAPKPRKKQRLFWGCGRLLVSYIGVNTSGSMRQTSQVVTEFQLGDSPRGRVVGFPDKWPLAQLLTSMR
jgi:hypothetical protein